MRTIFVLLCWAAAFPVAAETLVRSCPTKPATEAFDACSTSTWVRPVDAQWFVVNRRNVATNPWLKRNELVDTDRVYACSVESIVVGTPFGAGCVDGAGAKVRLPGQADNWLAVSALPPGSSPSVKEIPMRWGAPLLDLQKQPVTDATKAIGYLVHWREESSTTGIFTTIDVGNVLSYRLASDTRKCVMVQSVGAEGLGGLTDAVCKDPLGGAPVGLPGPPINFTVGE